MPLPRKGASSFLEGGARWGLLMVVLASWANAEEIGRAQYVMGTLLKVSMKGPDKAALDLAADRIFAETEKWDRLLSTYKADSEVSRVNRAAPEGVIVSTETAAFIRRSVEWAKRTGGAFDPTIGPLVDAWGFRGGEPRVPSEKEIREARALVGYEGIVVSDDARVRLTRQGMSLDFGAIGKGWALDRALARAREDEAVQEVVMNFGGQIRFWSRESGSWTTAIRHPRRDGESLEELAVNQNGSLSTSAASEKFVVATDPKSAEGEFPKRYGHILDPRTGYPAEGVESVTVWSEKAEDADVLSTALFVMGPEEARSFAEIEKIPALVVFHDKKSGLISQASPAWKKIFQKEKE
jgi:FAD:protein FMN transferase